MKSFFDFLQIRHVPISVSLIFSNLYLRGCWLIQSPTNYLTSPLFSLKDLHCGTKYFIRFGLVLNLICWGRIFLNRSWDWHYFLKGRFDVHIFGLRNGTFVLTDYVKLIKNNNIFCEESNVF